MTPEDALKILDLATAPTTLREAISEKQEDAAGEQHGVTVEQFKDLMKEYGAHCYSLHINP